MTSYQYRKSHCGGKTILRPSYLHNGISYTGKTTSLYWISPLGTSIHLSIPVTCTVSVQFLPNCSWDWLEPCPLQGMQSLYQTIEECWDQDAEARLSSCCIYERLMQLNTQLSLATSPVSPPPTTGNNNNTSTGNNSVVIPVSGNGIIPTGNGVLPPPYRPPDHPADAQVRMSDIDLENHPLPAVWGGAGQPRNLRACSWSKGNLGWRGEWEAECPPPWPRVYSVWSGAGRTHDLGAHKPILDKNIFSSLRQSDHF